VPDSRSHRGPDPRDAEAFAPDALPALRAAVADLAWLRNRGYAVVSALKLVGDRWNLTERQRMAVRRSACTDDDRNGRRARLIPPALLAGRPLWIDGFNVLTTIEAHLGGGVVIHCRDGTYRDIAGVHGTYRRVAETTPALDRLGARIESLRAGPVRWLFDRPVSNSGRVRAVVLEIAHQNGAQWSVDLVDNPDPILKAATVPVATADSVILDAGPVWFNLARDVIETIGGTDRVVDLCV
jgi:hypothetical protein